jgi:hypothetical protein
MVLSIYARSPNDDIVYINRYIYCVYGFIFICLFVYIGCISILILFIIYRSLFDYYFVSYPHTSVVGTIKGGRMWWTTIYM